MYKVIYMCFLWYLNFSSAYAQARSLVDLLTHNNAFVKTTHSYKLSLAANNT